MYLLEPKKYNTMERLNDADKNAQEEIKRLSETIEEIKAYRLKLAERAVQLQTMESHIRVSLKREKRYDNKIYYFLTKERVYSDETIDIMENTKYTGKERHKAIKAFEDIKKEFSQWEYVKSIEKGAWEQPVLQVYKNKLS